MRYLGIDFGTKKVGLALSDEAGTMGFPHAVVPNDTRLLEEVAKRIAAEDVQAVVIGESRDYSGKENLVAKEARSFGTLLAEKTGMPVHFEMEALTTQEARRTLSGERGAQTAMTDASAAALILTSYLSRHDHL